MDVIKMGGASGVDSATICEDLARLHHAGRRLLLYHGGSDETNRLAEELGHPPRFVTSVSGHTSRVTDRRTLEIFMMATALVNRRLVEQLQGLGVSAVGISGIDGRLLEGTRKDAIRVVENGRQRVIRDDWTGKPEKVNVELLTTLLDAGYLPVVAPLAISPAGEPLNVDGDRGSALVASSLNAENLLILTNVAGVLESFPDESTLIPHVPVERIDAVAELTEGRMRKKILGASEALARGVRRVIVADGRGRQPLTEGFEGRGTVLGTPLAPTSV